MVFVARGGQGHLSDIAIDDVRLLTGKDCHQINGITNLKNSNEEDGVTEENPDNDSGIYNISFFYLILLSIFAFLLYSAINF